MNDVARRANIAVGTLYLYFDSKEAIARAIAAETFQAASAAIMPLLDGRLTRPRITQLVQGVFDSVFSDHSFGRTGIPLHEALPTLAPESYAIVVMEIAHRLDLQMRRGYLRRYDPATMADFIVILLRRAVIESASTGNREREPYASTLTKLLAAALLPEPKPRAPRKRART